MSDQDALSVLSSIDEDNNDDDEDCENESRIRHQAIASTKLVSTNTFLVHTPGNGQASPFFPCDIAPHPHSSMQITGAASLRILSKAAANKSNSAISSLTPNGVHSSTQLSSNPMSVPQDTQDGAVHHHIVDLDADIEEEPEVKNLPDLMHSSQSSSNTLTVPKGDGGNVIFVHHHIVDLDDDDDMIADSVVHHHIVDLDDIINENREEEEEEELQDGIICAPFARTTPLPVKDLESAKEGAVLQEADYAGNIGRSESLRQGDCLQWCNVCMTVKDHSPTENGKRNGNGQEKSGKSHGPHTKKILDNVFGQSPAGQVTAIMGTSGSGKFYRHR